MRNDSDFNLFWQLALQTREQLHINEPVLPRQQKRTRLFGEMGTEEPFFFDDPKLYYISIFSVRMQQWHLLRIVFINVTTQYIVT